VADIKEGEKMIRGTTPTLEFSIPFDTGEIDEAFVTLSQNGTIILDKALSDCKCDDRKLSVRLSQEDTLKLSCDCSTEIQVRIRTKAGDALASDIVRVNTDRILKDGVI
jgi:hypothetical protein